MTEMYSPPAPEEKFAAAQAEAVPEIAPTLLAPEAANILGQALNTPAIHKHLGQLRSQEQDHIGEHVTETYDHTLRVTKSALKLAWDFREKASFNKDDLLLLARAGLAHDIGKLDLPYVPTQHENPDTGEMEPRMVRVHMLNRGLTDEEFELTKKHAMLSVARLQDEYGIDDPRMLALMATHHQKQSRPYLLPEDEEAVFDSLGLSDEDKKKVRELQSILEVADKFDARINKRVYKEAGSIKKVAEDFDKDFPKTTSGRRFARTIMHEHFGDVPELAPLD